MGQKINRMVVTAVMLALATALSMVKIWTMPLGGSITLLSMVPLTLLAVQYGTRWGLCASLLYALLQLALDLGGLMSWGMTPLIFVGAIVFDYLIAFGGLGLSGLFRKRGVTGICLGIALALIIRFASHFISGSLVFSHFCPPGWNVFWYALLYNSTYLLPEILLTMTGAVLLYRIPQIMRLMTQERH